MIRPLYTPANDVSLVQYFNDTCNIPVPARSSLIEAARALRLPGPINDTYAAEVGCYATIIAKRTEKT